MVSVYLKFFHWIPELQSHRNDCFYLFLINKDKVSWRYFLSHVSSYFSWMVSPTLYYLRVIYKKRKTREVDVPVSGTVGIGRCYGTQVEGRRCKPGGSGEVSSVYVKIIRTDCTVRGRILGSFRRVLRIQCLILTLCKTFRDVWTRTQEERRGRSRTG